MNFVLTTQHVPSYTFESPSIFHTIAWPEHYDRATNVLISQGIGVGIILQGELFHGDAYGAGEIGHAVVENGQPSPAAARLSGAHGSWPAPPGLRGRTRALLIGAASES